MHPTWRTLSTAFMACVLVLGALGGCNSYSVNQTSLVPAAILAPPVAADPGLDVSVTGAYTTGAGGNRSAGNESSLWVSRANLVSAAEVSSRVVGARMLWFHGFGQGAERVTRNNLGKPRDHVWAIGPELVLRAFADDPKHRLTFDFGTLFVMAPSVVVAACEDCGDYDIDRSGTYTDRSTALMVTGGLQYRLALADQLRIVWGFNAQTSVTNAFLLDREIPGRSKVSMGALHPVLSLGVEWSPTPWAALQPGVTWVAPPSPALYYPTATLTVRFHARSDMRNETDEPEAARVRILDQDVASL